MKSKRLANIASLINKNDNVIDVGCDHGLLSIHLAKNVGCKKIIASDINKNALNNAISNINKENLQDKITTILSDGIENIDTDGYNAIVISGMGTSTVLNILNNKDKLESINKIVIQSNNNLYALRKEMNKRGYIINNEICIYENKKYYVIIEFVLGNKKYSYKELTYGPVLMKSQVNKLYFESLKHKNENILCKLPKKKFMIRKYLKKQIKIINKILLEGR